MRSIARDDRNMHPASLGCPFRDSVGAAAEPPPGELGVFSVTGGKGGSAMSDSVSIGIGASAGGMY